ncbi:TetR/AcrR family transcriptional regulator [Sungkyunkwania multivorans]|uniref:TetR/AcrR family transcriptional regulator n=1 Tax=Sungkyunkwania multivorans TaxID=1173618 RepID=A0ABW3CYL5_9FLAO
MANIVQFDKDKVLTKVSEVFQTKGFNGTSMQDLVEATGLNRSSIYNSFGSKMHLYLMALDNYSSHTKEQTRKVIEKSRSGLSAIKLIFSLYISTILDDKEKKGCMIANCKTELASSGKQEIISWLQHSQEETLDFLEGLVAKGQIDGSINKKQSPSQYALYVFTALQGLKMTGILNHDHNELEALASTFIDTIT